MFNQVFEGVKCKMQAVMGVSLSLVTVCAG